MRPFVLMTLFAALMLAVPARAELGIGGYARAGQSGVPLRIFGPDANGTTPPFQEMSGPTFGARDTQWASYEPNEQLLYISDYYGQAIRVYPAFRSGDVAPLRVLRSAYLGQSQANAPIFAHGELAAIAINCCIRTWPLDAEGDDVLPKRTIPWVGTNPETQLNSPASLVYLPDTDEYAVVDFEPGTNASRIVFHARTASGNVPPTRMITGNGVGGAVAIAYDRLNRRLFMLGRSTLADQSLIGRVAVFPDSASGAAVPLYTIAGALTRLNRPAGHYFIGIAHDPYRRRIMVSSAAPSSSSEGHRMIVFDEDAAYNAEPLRDLGGEWLSPGNLGRPFSVPPWDTIRRNGFD